MNGRPWLRRGCDGSVTIAVHVQPGAKKTELAGVHGEALKVRLAAPPVDGKANAALVTFVARLLNVPRSKVTLLAGAASRQKVLRLEGVDDAVLATLPAGPGTV